MIAWRKRVKIRLIEYKGGKCETCGYSRCIEALQFHHRDPKEKDFQISGTTKAFETLKREVNKCSLLCANCHTELHAGSISYHSPVAQLVVQQVVTLPVARP